MGSEVLKARAAAAAIGRVPLSGVLGVGTGSTVSHFIEALASMSDFSGVTVASSVATAGHLRTLGVEVVDLADVEELDVYVDGADEIDPGLLMIKGGGGALTREKICAQAAGLFVCIADESKLVPELGTFPLAVEVLPIATRLVSGYLTDLGGVCAVREGYITDNGNLIIDVTGLTYSDPVALEVALDSFPGVVTSGLFARRPADVALIAGPGGVAEMSRP